MFNNANKQKTCRQGASKHMDDLNALHRDLERLVHNLTSGQGHVMTQVGHAAYQSIRRDETNTIKPCPSIYRFSIVTF